MVFSSPLFLFLFLPAVLSTYFVTPRCGRNLLLLIVSLFFYAWAEPAFVLVMAGSIALNYAFGLLVGRAGDPRARRRTVAVAVVVNVGVLATFKYLAFLGANLNHVLAGCGHAAVAVPELALPLGISFFTFHGLSYVIDVYRRTAAPLRNPIQMGLYMTFFPQLIAGPIIRYHEIVAQLPRRTVTLDGFANGTRRFIVGLGKKTLIANLVAIQADRIFALPPDQMSTAVSWLGVVCYTLQIYFDFSGYSDMAIGLAAMFGFTFPENFDYPYASRSVTEFWRRWHMSLSRWFRDYLYVPLGGNRRGALRTYVNLITVFFLCGLWHGAAWTFVLWGLYHGTFLILERVGGRWLDALWPPLRHVYLMVVVMVGWVFFRAADLPHALGYLSVMSGNATAGPSLQEALIALEPPQAIALVAGLVGSVPWMAALQRRRDALTHPLPAFALAGVDTIVLSIVLAAAVLSLAAGTYNPFIYFRF